MAWIVRYSAAAGKDFRALDPQVARRIIAFIETRILPDPRGSGSGKTLKGDQHAYRYRMGDYRIICDLQDGEETVWVVRVGHRSSIYLR